MLLHITSIKTFPEFEKLTNKWLKQAQNQSIITASSAVMGSEDVGAADNHIPSGESDWEKNPNSCLFPCCIKFFKSHPWIKLCWMWHFFFPPQRVTSCFTQLVCWWIRGCELLHMNTSQTGVSSFTCLRTESPITRVWPPAGVSPSGEKRLDTWTGWWCTWGFCLRLCFLLTVTQPPSFPSCLGSAGEQLAGPTLSSAAPATGAWLATGEWRVRSRVSNSVILASRAANMLHLLQVSLLLKEAEE